MSLTASGFGQIKVDVTPAQWSELRAAQTLVLDYTIPTTSDGSWGGGWGELNAAVNSEAGGWQAPSDWQDLDLTPGTHTFSLDLSGVTIPEAPGGWAQFFIQHNWGTATGGANSALYIDNIRAGEVPEPASLALLGLGGLALLRRRRA